VFLYPALTIGFLFVAVPLLVHLINMLRHRRQRWAAMDFLLASYRKQKKWIRLRQLLILLSRIAVAFLLIALLSGWTGGRKMLGMLGGQTTHHIVILDDSYSMGDQSYDSSARTVADSEGGSESVTRSATAYGRALQSLQDLTRQLAMDDQEHQLTVMRASRAAMATRGGSESGDAAADISAQTITSDASIINRLMGTSASPLNTDLVAALNLATALANSTPADAKYLYIASDFRDREWGTAERLAESMKGLASDVSIRMIDCATKPAANLAITDVSPRQDVWVAGVPVVVDVTVRNYGKTEATNVSIATRVIRYSDEVQLADPTLSYSGEADSLPPLIIESLKPGAEMTKSFQVYVTQTGTHVIEASLPEDALAIDNTRSCTLPLSDVERVLVIDGDPDGRGAFHVASVLNPGSQVRIGAVPEIQPPSFLRSASAETLSAYRAIFLIDLPDIGENSAAALSEYVNRGGGIAWFLGSRVNSQSYNSSLLAQQRFLLPGLLSKPQDLPQAQDNSSADVQFADKSTMLQPLRGGGDAAFALVGVSRSWALSEFLAGETEEDEAPTVRTLLNRRDGSPLVTRHEVGRGRVVTVLMGLDGTWTNWPGDPTFVVFLLQANADLWSGAAPTTQRYVDSPLTRILSQSDYTAEASYLPATSQPPRVPIEMTATVEATSTPDEPLLKLALDPNEMVIAGEPYVDEILQPGLSEWTLRGTDGRTKVVPVASVIRIGEGDLSRADRASITQQLLPVEVTFVSSTAWSEANNTAGSSTITLVLLGLLAAFLAGEQALAYWASYHVSPSQLRTERSALSHAGGRR
jgi:hypothetical protein